MAQDSFPLVDRLRRLQPKDVLACDEEIRQRAGDDEPVRVLGEAAVAHLGEAEHALDHANRVLDSGPDPRLPPIGGATARPPMRKSRA